MRGVKYLGFRNNPTTDDRNFIYLGAAFTKKNY